MLLRRLNESCIGCRNLQECIPLFTELLIQELAAARLGAKVNLGSAACSGIEFDGGDAAHCGLDFKASVIEYDDQSSNYEALQTIKQAMTDIEDKVSQVIATGSLL